MAALGKLLTNLQKLDSDKIVHDSFEKTKEVFADLQVEQQLKGITADGSFMPDYSETSVEVFGKPAGPIRLRDTGDFQSAEYARINQDTITLYSTNNKTEMLEKRYKKKGKMIFGLSDKFKQEARLHLGPVFHSEIKKATGL